jgi:DNA primase catalytic core
MSFIDEVRDRTDLVTLIGRSTQLKQQNGRLIMCKCPFHADGTASLAIYVDQQRWWCYGGCQTGGDCFDWVQRRDNVNFIEARNILARDAGVEIPQFKPEAPEKKSEREQAATLMIIAAEFYHQQLWSEAGEPYRDYLLKRGFDEQFWREWQLGASPAGSKDAPLLKHLRANGQNIQLAIKIGLLGKDDDSGYVYDVYKGRVVIPFIEPGRVAFFTGRTIYPKKEGDSNYKKYRHIHNSELYTKPPFNWRARGDDLVIVEGALDAMAVQRLGGENVAAMALMGLAEGDFDFSKVLRGRKRVFLALDQDAAGQATVEALMAKLPDAQIVTWPAKDAADWMLDGATAAAFHELLNDAPTWIDKLIADIRAAKEPARPALVERAIAVAARMPLAQGDIKANEIKRAAGQNISKETIKALLKKARGQNSGAAPPPPPKDKAVAEGADDGGFYRVGSGGFWAGRGERSMNITSGGVAYYRRMVKVDDGEAKDNELELVIELEDGKEVVTRLPANKSSETSEVAAAIKAVVGPKLTISANGRSHLIPAMEWLTKDKQMEEKVEIARTGWYTVEGVDVPIYITPGGTVGELPATYQVALPQGLERYAVKDGGDEAFKQGLDGLINGLLPAFDYTITMPMIAFALLPPMARFIPEGTKFVMHLVGETGSLKTSTSKILMALYGDFATKPPMASWRSTINSLEKLFFWIDDCLGMVDDYKPRIVKLWDFVDLIQRYADGNGRDRLARDTSLRRREAIRGWMLSTGEDLPQGESSALARMVSLRFKRRPKGAVYNADLGKAARLAEFFPTVMARWIAWLRVRGDKEGFPAKYTLHMQQVGEMLQQDAPDTPNIPRISANIAMLWTAWAGFREFVLTATDEQDMHLYAKLPKFGEVAAAVAFTQARHVQEDKVTAVFLNALRDGIDGGRFKIAARGKNNAHEMANTDLFVGWYDAAGFYLLPASFNAVMKWSRETGTQLGFTNRELYKMLDEEGLFASKGKGGDYTQAMRMGGGGSATSGIKRVMHLKPGVLPSPIDDKDPAPSEPLPI